MTTRTEVSRNLYGGVLEYDAAGHYAGIELLNLVICGTGKQTLDPDTDLLLVRRSHDFGRRLGWKAEFENDPRCSKVVGDIESAQVLRALLRCLQLEIPNSKKEPRWERVHFFPYTRSLVHWDARERTSAKADAAGATARIERTYLRGGGALAHRILRSDSDRDRLQSIRGGLERLFSVTDASPLEYLASTLKKAGYNDPKPVTDEIEQTSVSRNDPFEDVYRDGVQNIVGNVGVTSPARVRALMSWTSMWLLLMQYRRSLEYLGKQYLPLICDCGSGRPQLRRASQMSLKEAQQSIVTAVSTASPDLSDKACNQIRGFFVASAATIGFLNAWSGRRHFTFGTDLLETMVLATIPQGTEVTFERFVSSVLGERLGLIVGRGAAEQAGLLTEIDASVFEENETRFAAQLAAAGLMTQYSDATRMVSSEGLS
jgi:hypothetical protein